MGYWGSQSEVKRALPVPRVSKLVYMLMIHLYSIQSFFNGIGCISHRKNSNLVSFAVSYLEGLINIIIPHFDQYHPKGVLNPRAPPSGDPLQSAKKVDYSLWKQCIELIRGADEVRYAHIVREKKHFTQDGLIQIFTLKSALNRGLSENCIFNKNGISTFGVNLKLSFPRSV